MSAAVRPAFAPFGWSVALHAALAGLLLVSLARTRVEAPPSAVPIDAVIVDQAVLQAVARQRSEDERHRAKQADLQRQREAAAAKARQEESRRVQLETDPGRKLLWVLRTDLEKLCGTKVKVDVNEITVPDIDAKLVADNIAGQLERRISHSRAMKRAIGQAMRQGAQGIKIMCAGRLGGSEMKRREWLRDGRVPLHTLRADIDYALSEALTTFGRIGVKVWIYKGEKMPEAAAVPEVAEDVYVSE